MCGIAGAFSFDQKLSVDPSDVVAAIDRSLAHRGPDGAGSHLSSDGRLLMVHRRLAILDVTSAAAQPMASEDARYRIVFNGEIYNFKELRAGLESLGTSFRTNSDTEVVLHLLMREGTEALGKLRGMFALALWDELQGSLLVARDRFGIKPLYIASGGRCMAFASEIRALRAAGLAGDIVSAAGVLSYFHWGSVIPPIAWLEGVEALPAGTWRLWHRSGAMRGGRFADIRRDFVAAVQDVSTTDASRRRIENALEDSVRAHLVADVPVGLFLSGGIDSSILAVLLARLGRRDVQTYTVIAEEAGYSEEVFARSVARALGLQHETLPVDLRSVLEHLPNFLRHLGQPSADGLNSYFVSLAVAQTGTKVALSGTGGDEMFGGYPSFHRVPTGVRTLQAAGRALFALGPAAGKLLSPWRRAKWQQFLASRGEPAEVYRAQRGLFMPAEMSELLGPVLREPDVLRDARERLASAEEDMLRPVGPEALESTVARLESRFYLGSQLLRDIDATSMAHSLEVRVPFVDHQLLSTAWPTLSRHRELLRGKQFLRELLMQQLPSSIHGRPKQGFTLPFDQWMRGPLGDFVRDGLDALSKEGWVRTAIPSSLWDAWQSGLVHWSRPWALGIAGQYVRGLP